MLIWIPLADLILIELFYDLCFSLLFSFFYKIKTSIYVSRQVGTRGRVWGGLRLAVQQPPGP